VADRYKSLSVRETQTGYFIMEGKVMIEVTKKAADMIKEFLKNQQGPSTVRILTQVG
jgi:hypothetical protein